MIEVALGVQTYENALIKAIQTRQKSNFDQITIAKVQKAKEEFYFFP